MKKKDEDEKLIKIIENFEFKLIHFPYKYLKYISDNNDNSDKNKKKLLKMLNHEILKNYKEALQMNKRLTHFDEYFIYEIKIIIEKHIQIMLI